MKKAILLLFLFSFSSFYGQTNHDFVRYKTMSLNHIEEELILQDWSFKGSKKEEKREIPEGGDIFEKRAAARSKTYEARTYEYIGYAGDKTILIVTDFAEREVNEVTIQSDNIIVYKKILQDLVSSDYRTTNEESPYTLARRMQDYNIGEKVLVDSNGKVYQRGNSRIHLLINRYAIVASKNNNDKTFSYYDSQIIDEFKIIID